MAEPFQIPGLAELREQIDEVDSRLLELLNRRAGLSLAVGQAKKKVSGKVFDAAREARLLERLASLNEGPLKADAMTSPIAIASAMLRLTATFHRMTNAI